MMRVSPTQIFLIEIHGHVKWMDRDKYTQWAFRSPPGRFYVNRGAAGGLSISDKRVTILAQKILYWNN